MSHYREFKITDVMGAHEAIACRYALSRLSPSGAATKEKKDLIQATLHIQKLWRRRLSQLRRAGWGPVQNPVDLVYAANCPPVGVFTNQTGLRRCKRDGICPFCWCKSYVYPAFRRVAALIADRTVDCVDVVEIRTRREYVAEEWGVGGPLDWIRRRKGLYVQQRMKGCLGAFVLCSVEVPQRGRPSYIVHHNILGVVPVGKTVSFDEPDDEPDDTISVSRRAARHVGPVRDTLAAVVGRICLYPPSLIHSDPVVTLDLLREKSRQNVRFASFYGALRRAKGEI